MDELLEVAHEQLRWIRAASIPQVRATLETVLKKSSQRQAYELCDGTRTSSDVAKAVGVSKASITSWTTQWRELRVADDLDDRKIKHLVSLGAVGISLKVKEEQ